VESFDTLFAHPRTAAAPQDCLVFDIDRIPVCSTKSTRLHVPYLVHSAAARAAVHVPRRAVLPVLSPAVSVKDGAAACRHHRILPTMMTRFFLARACPAVRCPNNVAHYRPLVVRGRLLNY
jgi:hypothetical protein